MKLKNTGSSDILLPVKSGNAVIKRQDSAEIADSDWKALKDRKSVKAMLDRGTLVAGKSAEKSDDDDNGSGEVTKSSNKDDLLAAAQEKDIAGADKMTKAELIEALGL